VTFAYKLPCEPDVSISLRLSGCQHDRIFAHPAMAISRFTLCPSMVLLEPDCINKIQSGCSLSWVDARLQYALAMNSPDAMLEHRIRQRAYEIYLARLGNPALHDWLQAECEILKETTHFEQRRSAPETGPEKSGVPLKSEVPPRK
jgi:hypothetical protein